ncbi:hypothetical protein C1708_06885 [Streptomyces sp. DH-12]|nr:hypothetical protein C1708_06885 [Streptomyces sp. DH-12]
MRAAAFSSPPFLVSVPVRRVRGWSKEARGTGRPAGPPAPGRLPGSPEEDRKTAGALRSYESTRCLRWPANSFMVSVTDPGGVRGGVLGTAREKST